jgi:hypothetical protein
MKTWKAFLPAHQKVAAIAKAVSRFAKTGIYALNSNVLNEDDAVSGEVPTTVNAIT